MNRMPAAGEKSNIPAVGATPDQATNAKSFTRVGAGLKPAPTFLTIPIRVLESPLS